MVENARRRGFTAEYKLRVLAEANRCTEPGEVGALLRREELYSFLLSAWRQQCLEAHAALPRHKDAVRHHRVKMRRDLQGGAEKLDSSQPYAPALPLVQPSRLGPSFPTEIGS